MMFDFEKFKEVCHYSLDHPIRGRLHVLDINTDSSREEFLEFIEQHGIGMTEYARDTGYIIWCVEDDMCYGVSPSEIPLTEVHTMADFSMNTIQVDNNTMLNFLGV